MSFRSFPGPTQSLIQFPAEKRLRREADHSPPASAIVKNTLIYTSTKTKLRDFSPQANYTDRATAACRGG
jgi:hypothetical protein